MGCICEAMSLWFGFSFGRASGTKTTITSYKKRYCTDLPFLGLLGAVIAVIVTFVWIPAFQRGKFDFYYPQIRLLQPHDYNGNRCGDGDFKEMPYVYWPVVDEHILQNKQFMLCTNTCDVTEDENKNGGHRYPSKERYGYCLPHCGKAADALMVKVGEKVPCLKTHAPQLKGEMKKLASSQLVDLVRSKWLILTFIGIALILCFLFIFAMKLFAGPIIYFSIMVIIAALAALSYGCLMYANTLERAEDPKWKKGLEISAYVIAGIDALFTLIIFCLRDRIKMAIEVVKSTSRAFEDVRLVPFFPVISFIIYVIFFICWSYVALYLFAAADTVKRDIPAKMFEDKIKIDGYDFEGLKDNERTYQKLDWDKTCQKFFSAHLFLYLWISAIIYYCTYVIISGVIADWYFTPRDEKSGKKLRKNKWSKGYNDEIHFTTTPIWDSMWRTLRYHLGTITFASLIIAIVQFIRCCVLYMMSMCDGGVRPNAIQNELKCVVNCLLKCLECILDKVNKNALIYNAIYGDAFCPSAVGSFKLMWSNLIRAAFISMISRFVTVLGKWMITLVNVGLCAIMLFVVKANEKNPIYSEDVHCPILPLIIVGIMSYFVACSFLAVYDNAIDTVFLCFLVDEKQNAASGVMVADKGLKSVVSKYEDAAKATAEGSIVFTSKKAAKEATKEAAKKDSKHVEEIEL